MGLFKSIGSWVHNFFDEDNKLILNKNYDYVKSRTALIFMELAINRAVSFIALSISKCEFKTFIDGVSTKGIDYYDWNIRPNATMSASKFKYELVYKLLNEGDVLIVKGFNNDYLLVDSFTKEERNLRVTFSNVTVKDFQFRKTFSIEEVIYYQLENDDIRSVLSRVCDLYAEVMTHSIEVYKDSFQERIKVKLPTMFKSEEDGKAKIEDLFANKLKSMFSNRKSAIPEYDNWNIELMNGNKATINAKEIIDIINDANKMVANAYRVPSTIVEGDGTKMDDVWINTLSNAILPITNMMSEVNTHFLYGFDAFQNNCYFEISLSKIKYFDLFKNAPSIDKLIASGYMCIDGVLEESGRKPLNTEFSKQHFMTKNYATAEELTNNIGEEGKEE